jgi:hypothetical protein
VTIDPAQAFIDQCVTAAADLSLHFAGQPDAKVASSLAEIRANLEAELTKEFVGTGMDVQALVARFVQTILQRKIEIEQGVGP